MKQPDLSVHLVELIAQVQAVRVELAAVKEELARIKLDVVLTVKASTKKRRRRQRGRPVNGVA